jgi:hypothetical protein
VVLARGDVEVASWAMELSGHPDLEAVAELARLQLAARRVGCSIRLRDPCCEVLALIELVGLADVVILFDDVVRAGGEGPETEGGNVGCGVDAPSEQPNLGVAPPAGKGAEEVERRRREDRLERL